MKTIKKFNDFKEINEKKNSKRSRKKAAKKEAKAKEEALSLETPSKDEIKDIFAQLEKEAE